MDNDTVFYVLGGCLVALALITTFVGLRWEKFPPSRAALLGVAAIFALVVGATATFAWRNGEDEQEHRNAEIAAGELPSPQEALQGEGEAVEEETTETTGGGETSTTTAEESTVDGAQVFADQGCAGCHTLVAANATGTTGPDLDAALKGKDAAFIEQSIVDPNAEIAKGFSPDIMPQSFASTLSPEELDALVQYLSESTAG